MESTLVLVKPDGVQRGLVGEVISRFERRGYRLAALKYLQASEALIKAHYAALSSKKFFEDLVKHSLSGPIVAMIWEGDGAVKAARDLIGATNPLAATAGSIRGDFCIDIARNAVHGSDSEEAAAKEVALWFQPNEVLHFKPANHSLIYDR